MPRINADFGNPSRSKCGKSQGKYSNDAIPQRISEMASHWLLPEQRQIFLDSHWLMQYTGSSHWDASRLRVQHERNSILDGHYRYSVTSDTLE